MPDGSPAQLLTNPDRLEVHWPRPDGSYVFAIVDATFHNSLTPTRSPLPTMDQLMAFVMDPRLVLPESATGMTESRPVAVRDERRHNSSMGSRLRLTVCDAGPLTLDRSDLMVGASGPLTVPSTVVVIEHDRHGLVLFDTGVNHRVADDAGAAEQWGPGLRDRYGASRFTREDAIDAQLERLGYRCADVTTVVYSHLHLDHAGGMEHFPQAVHVLQHDELRHAWWPDRWTARGYALADYLPGRGFDYLELDGDVDLFDDGSLRVVRLSGHTPGSQGLVVDLPQRGRVAFVGDAAHLRE